MIHLWRHHFPAGLRGWKPKGNQHSSWRRKGLMHLFPPGHIPGLQGYFCLGQWLEHLKGQSRILSYQNLVLSCTRCGYGVTQCSKSFLQVHCPRQHFLLSDQVHVFWSSCTTSLRKGKSLSFSLPGWAGNQISHRPSCQLTLINILPPSETTPAALSYPNSILLLDSPVARAASKRGAADWSASKQRGLRPHFYLPCCPN